MQPVGSIYAPVNVFTLLSKFVWSQAFSNTNYLLTYKHTQINTIDGNAIRLCRHFVAFFVYKIIQLHENVLFWGAKNNFINSFFVECILLETQRMFCVAHRQKCQLNPILTCLKQV